ncbi:hypothetical protein CERSUDRAFT_70692 [Gelatoporia subvermispora B]|uniref:Enoyl reductase (ER) domain-containing protein n=1 Tax=Ceriporiopsis subvermispora (strain B) TaxID=914234 RepID=M2RN37_CERS8|nr:hypothetical protein CERSUDRAFT_70692 [Gelatoporia subvermispora B]
MPAQQKALFLTAKHGDWAVGTTDIPTPGTGQLLVKIHSTALNPLDWKIQAYGLFIENYPAILGSDAAGTVEVVGEGVEGFGVGDRGFFTNSFGTYQQYALSNADVTAKIPAGMSFDEAATLPVGVATGATGLFDQHADDNAQLYPPWEDGGRGKHAGKSIVIFGGSGSVGQYTIQLAKLAGFAPLIVTASLRNADVLKALGATHVIDRTLPTDVLVEQIKHAAGAPVETVFDTVSSRDTQNEAFDILAPTGVLVTVLPDEVDAEKKNAAPGKKVVHVVANVNLPQKRTAGISLYKKLASLLEEGVIKPNHVVIVPGGLSSVPVGLEKLRNGQISAVKLVVRPQESV